MNQSRREKVPQIAVVGLGSRVGDLMAAAHRGGFPFEVIAIADPDVPQERVARLPSPSHGPRYYDSLESLLGAGEEPDGVVIGARCDLHASLACLASGLEVPIFLEKPVGICRDDLSNLRAAFLGREDQVTVSFPLRVSPLFMAVQEIVHSGRLGQINQIQAVNYVPYGGVYFARWYRDSRVTGGMWLQKATHDFDYLRLLAGADPVGIYALESQRVFGGDRPFSLHCSECSASEECLESPLRLQLHGDHGGMGDDDHGCVFAEGIGNHDAGSALLRFSNGLHVSYNQNFVTRRPAGRRGAVITGYLGTLEFDWRQEMITISDHKRSRVDKIEVKTHSTHNGGDLVLWQNFLDVIRGRGRASPNLFDGVTSCEICLGAIDSCATGMPQELVEAEPLCP